MEITNKFMSIKKALDSYLGIPGTNILSELQGRSDLGNFEKNIIYYHLNPVILKDGELTGRIKEIRRSRNDLAGKGFLGHSEEEQIELYKALGSAQYKRYILHLLGAYQKTSYVFPQDGEQQCKCDLCGKDIFEHKLWWTSIVPQVPREQENKEWLAWFSKNSSTSLCLDCIAQLKYLHEMLKIISPELLTPFWLKTRL